MTEFLGILLIAAVAGLIVLLSYVRKRRIQPYLDAFARAFCEAADNQLSGVRDHGQLCTELQAKDVERVLPIEEQPAAIRALFERGVDDKARECIQAMFEMRKEAQSHLTTINLIGNKVNSILNHLYDAANISLGIIENPACVISSDNVRDFNFFINKQAFIRSTTLGSIVSDECKAEIIL